MKIGVLGGTFDPVHQGHLRLGEAARSQFHLDKVLFVPASVPPHKTGKTGMTAAPHRFRMTELAIKNYPHFELSDIELGRPGISYTVDTLRALKEERPQDDFYLIIGSDSAKDFYKWKEPEEIKKLAKLLVARRPGYSLSGNPDIFCYIEMPETDLSSSALRELLAKGETLGPEILPADVENYIRKMSLYR